MTTNLPKVKEKFNSQIPFDEAMNVLASLSNKPLAWTDEDYFAIYGYTPEQLEAFRQDPEFTKAVHLAVQELKDSGGSIKQKSRQQLDHYLDNTVPNMMSQDLDKVPAKDKIALLTFLAKLSGMETDTKTKEGSGGQQAVPTFNLILTTTQPTQIASEPRIINQE